MGNIDRGIMTIGASLAVLIVLTVFWSMVWGGLGMTKSLNDEQSLEKLIDNMNRKCSQIEQASSGDDFRASQSLEIRLQFSEIKSLEKHSETKLKAVYDEDEKDIKEVGCEFDIDGNPGTGAYYMVIEPKPDENKIVIRRK